MKQIITTVSIHRTAHDMMEMYENPGMNNQFLTNFFIFMDIHYMIFLNYIMGILY